MTFRVSRLLFEGLLKKAYKTMIKHNIIDLEQPLLTRHAAPRIHKHHGCYLEGSKERLKASCGPSGSHLGPSEGLVGA